MAQDETTETHEMIRLMWIQIWRSKCTKRNSKVLALFNSSVRALVESFINTNDESNSLYVHLYRNIVGLGKIKQNAMFLVKFLCKPSSSNIIEIKK